jgi:hypothetical protein
MAVYLTLDNIVCDHLAEKSRSKHYYYKTAMFAANAVNDNGLQHYKQLLLTRAKDGNNQPLDHFVLPADCNKVALIAVRYGDYYEPVYRIEELMGYTPKFPLAGSGSSTPVTSAWRNAPAVDNGSWNALPVDGIIPERGKLGVRVNMADGVIVVPRESGGQELYLVYEGYGTVDTMTAIPAAAKQVIFSFIDWKWAARKRNGGASAEAQAHKGEFEEALRKYKYAQQDDVTMDRILHAAGKR